MTADVFVDTNILLYAIDEAPNAAQKRDRARTLLLTESWGWSVQIASEFFVNATSMPRPFRLAPADAAAFMEAWLRHPTAAITADTVRRAVSLHPTVQPQLLGRVRARGSFSAWLSHSV